MRRWVIWVGVLLIILGIVFTCLGIFVWGKDDDAPTIDEGNNEGTQDENQDGGENNQNGSNEGNTDQSGNQNTGNENQDGNGNQNENPDIKDENDDPAPPVPVEKYSTIDISMIASNEINLSTQTHKTVVIDCTKELATCSEEGIRICNKQIIVTSNITKVIFKGTNTADSRKYIGGINIKIEDRDTQLVIELDSIGLKLSQPIYFEGDATIGILASNNRCYLHHEKNETVIDVKNAIIRVTADLEIGHAGASGYVDGLTTVIADSLLINGSKVLSVIGADGIKGAGYEANRGGNGGIAVRAENLRINESPIVKFVGGNGGQGGQGATGSRGTDGAKGNNESQGEDPTYGYNGRPGGQGGQGGQGGRGGNGASALLIKNSPIISENAQFYLNAGNGGKGGQGGQGGQGGDGGDGGDDDHWSFIWAGDMSGGEGGKGGPGGEGGQGGEAGLGGLAIELIDPEIPINVGCTYLSDGVPGLSGDVGDTGSYGYSGDHGYAGSGG